MSDQNTFFDPLEDIMNRHQGNSVEEPQTTPVEDDDKYGENDLAKEIEAENLAEQQAREQRAQEQMNKVDETKATGVLPPQSLDKEFQKEAIGFQGTTLEIVGRMIDAVAQKHNLTSGGIPESTEADPDLRMHVMGDLIEQYHINGEIITPEFENIVLKNWEGYVDPNLKEDVVEENKDEKPVEVEEVKETIPQININVEQGSDVTVNVDPEIVAEMSTTRKVNIQVIETSADQMLAARMIQNSQKDGIITPYSSDIYDVPLTLPLSGYRCTLKPVNYYEFIQLGSSPSSGNPVDIDKKQWSIIYDHVKNVSIGEFKDFEDFMKKTKYSDRELLMWGVLIASADEEETLSLTCNNPKCQKHHTIKYKPRSIIHVNDDLANKFKYQKTHSVAPGDAALKHFIEINSTVRRYKLPNTGYIVEIDERPSAYDFINRRYPLMDELRERFTDPDHPDADLSENAEFNYLMTQALFITSISKIVDDTEYRYTNWDDIERIITKSLDMRDAAILMQLIGKLSAETASPMSFYLEDFTCDACGKHQDRIPIPDIGSILIFQLSQRLSSTEINLTEMELN